MTEENCPCKWCGTPTRMLGTKMCDGCWELDLRIRNHLALAQRMLSHYVPITPPVAAQAQAVPKFTDAEIEANPRLKFEPEQWVRRDDGQVVRLDRWEWGFRAIVSTLFGNRHEFEISEVVEAVEALAAQPKADSTEPHNARQYREGYDQGRKDAQSTKVQPLTDPSQPWTVEHLRNYPAEALKLLNRHLTETPEVSDAEIDAAWDGLPGINIHNEANSRGLKTEILLRRYFARAILALRAPNGTGAPFNPERKTPYELGFADGYEKAQKVAAQSTPQTQLVDARIANLMEAWDFAQFSDVNLSPASKQILYDGLTAVQEMVYGAPKAQPLTDEQIVNALEAYGLILAYRDYDHDIACARAIEAAHGIVSSTKGEGS